MKPTDKHTGLSHGLLRALLHYEPDTGVFTWLVQPRKDMWPGSRAGHLHKASGYWLIKIADRQYHASRLAWLYMSGEWPAEMVDHVNMERADDRWDNLRQATRSQNNANRKAAATKANGIKGVYQRKSGRWAAVIRVDQQLKYLGTFDAPDLAADAYAEAASEHFGKYARTA